jgi:preprotein translocase subunit SecB
LPEKVVDFAAAGRVAKRVELKAVRVTEVSAKCDPKIKGPLEATLDLECAVIGRESSALEVACDYRFTAHTPEAQAAEAAIKYLLVYEIQGGEPLADEDIAEFAVANGTLHSWPFAREFLYGLTSKMGYFPYTLATFHFKPKPREKEKKDANEKATATTEHSAPQPTG